MINTSSHSGKCLTFKFFSRKVLLKSKQCNFVEVKEMSQPPAPPFCFPCPEKCYSYTYLHTYSVTDVECYSCV